MLTFLVIFGAAVVAVVVIRAADIECVNSPDGDTHLASGSL